MCAWTCTGNSYRKSHQFSNILYQQDLGAIFISICPGAAALASQYTSLNAQYYPLKVLQTPGLFTVNLQCSHLGASFTGKQEMQIFGSSTRGNCVCSKQWNMYIFKKILLPLTSEQRTSQRKVVCAPPTSPAKCGLLNLGIIVSAETAQQC